MPMTTARILQSTGLNANVSAIAARELGLTSDTERPVMGATVAGPMWMGTEETIAITTTAPAALPMLRRSKTLIFVDSATAGGNVALDIQNGASVVGYEAKVIVTGPAIRACTLTYGSGLVEYIATGCALDLVWTGSAWATIAPASQMPVGSIISSIIELTQSARQPFIALDSDKVISTAQSPLLVSAFRAVKANVLGVTDFSVTVSGSNVTFVAAADKLLTLIQNDAIVSKYQADGNPANFLNGSNYASNPRCVNIAGTDYVITGLDLVTRIMTVTGSPATGAQTASVYTYRIEGSSTTIKLHKICGFVGVAAGDAGGEVVGGFRKMDRGQHHFHNLKNSVSGSITSTIGMVFATTNAPTGVTAGASGQIAPLSVDSALTDGTNGTPRTGKTTDPRTYGMILYVNAGILLSAA